LIAYGRWAVFFPILFVLTFWLSDSSTRLVARVSLLATALIDVFLVTMLAKRLPTTLDDDGGNTHPNGTASAG
jgi:hypothetical protein